MLEMRLTNLSEALPKALPVLLWLMLIPLAANWHLQGNPPICTPPSVAPHVHTYRIHTSEMDWPHSQGLGGYIKGSLTLSLADCQEAGGQYKWESCPTLAISVGNQVVFDKVFNGWECSMWIRTFALYGSSSLNLKLGGHCLSSWGESPIIILWLCGLWLGLTIEPWGAPCIPSLLFKPSTTTTDV